MGSLRGLADRDFLQIYIMRGRRKFPSPRIGLHRRILQGVHCPHTGYDAAKYGVKRFELAGCARSRHDKELAPIGVGATVSHGNRAGSVLQSHSLCLEVISRTPETRPSGIARLNYETLDDAVENDAVKVVMSGQEDKAINGNWCHFRQQLYRYGSVAGGQNCTVLMGTVEGHAGNM